MMQEKLTAFVAAGAKQITRRETWGLVALGAAGALGWSDDALAKRKKKKKEKTSKKQQGGCKSPYFSCNGVCKLAGACCDAIPELSCAWKNGTPPGSNWICCDVGNFCVDVAHEDNFCGTCETRCPYGTHCLNGTCLS